MPGQKRNRVLKPVLHDAIEQRLMLLKLISAPIGFACRRLPKTLSLVIKFVIEAQQGRRAAGFKQSRLV
jgi:hypothetical protein